MRGGVGGEGGPVYVDGHLGRRHGWGVGWLIVGNKMGEDEVANAGGWINGRIYHLIASSVRI